MKIPFDFVVPEYMKGINWERLREELKLPSKQFWGLQDLRRRKRERQARFNFRHKYMLAKGYKYMLAKGYKYKEKNGVYYYWKEE